MHNRNKTHTHTNTSKNKIPMPNNDEMLMGRHAHAHPSPIIASTTTPPAPCISLYYTKQTTNHTKQNRQEICTTYYCIPPNNLILSCIPACTTYSIYLLYHPPPTIHTYPHKQSHTHTTLVLYYISNPAYQRIIHLQQSVTPNYRDMDRERKTERERTRVHQSNPPPTP